MTDSPAEELPLTDEIFQRMDELTRADFRSCRTGPTPTLGIDEFDGLSFDPSQETSERTA
jgi:hypothetical protein